MTNEKILVEIDEKGFIKTTVNGLSGPSCIDAVTKILKDIAVISDIDKTDEFSAHVETNVSENKKLRLGRSK